MERNRSRRRQRGAGGPGPLNRGVASAVQQRSGGRNTECDGIQNSAISVFSPPLEGSVPQRLGPRNPTRKVPARPRSVIVGFQHDSGQSPWPVF
jgi:hypothetical protein